MVSDQVFNHSSFITHHVGNFGLGWVNPIWGGGQLMPNMWGLDAQKFMWMHMEGFGCLFGASGSFEKVWWFFRGCGAQIMKKTILP